MTHAAISRSALPPIANNVTIRTRLVIQTKKRKQKRARAYGSSALPAIDDLMRITGRRTDSYMYVFLPGNHARTGPMQFREMRRVEKKAAYLYIYRSCSCVVIMYSKTNWILPDATYSYMGGAKKPRARILHYISARHRVRSRERERGREGESELVCIRSSSADAHTSTGEFRTKRAALSRLCEEERES